MEEVEKDVAARKESVKTIEDSMNNMNSSQANNPTSSKLEKFMTEMTLWRNSMDQSFNVLGVPASANNKGISQTLRMRFLRTWARQSYFWATLDESKQKQTKTRGFPADLKSRARLSNLLPTPRALVASPRLEKEPRKTTTAAKEKITIEGTSIGAVTKILIHAIGWIAILTRRPVRMSDGLVRTLITL